MKLRFEGYHHAEAAAAKVLAMKRSVDAMVTKVARMAEALRSE